MRLAVNAGMHLNFVMKVSTSLDILILSAFSTSFIPLSLVYLMVKVKTRWEKSSTTRRQECFMSRMMHYLKTMHDDDDALPEDEHGVCFLHVLWL